MTIWSGERHVRFPYTDSNGNHTQRDLLLRKVYRDGDTTYIQGFSYLREDERTFRLDRVTGNFIDADSGEAGSLDVLLGIPTDFLNSNTIQRHHTGKRSTSTTRSRRRKPVKAPSGFEFPSIAISPDSLVEIVDETDYRDNFLSWLEPEERRDYSEKDFLEELDWGILDIEVQPFEEILTPEKLKKLGHNISPEAISIIRDSALTYGCDAIKIDSPIKKKMVDKGFLDPVDLSDTALLRKLLSSLQKDQLVTEAKRLGIKVSQKKADIIEQLIPHAAKLAISFAHPSKRIHAFLDNLSGAFIEDIKKTLSDLPAAYHAAVWKQLEDDNSLPDTAREKASELYMQYEEEGNQSKRQPQDSNNFETYSRIRQDGVHEIVITTDLNEKIRESIEQLEKQEKKIDSNLGKVALWVVAIIVALVIFF